MPNIRIGFGTDFNLTNEQIGIGLTNQSVRLQVAGNIRAERLITTGSGINTFYSYDGFLNDKQESDYDLSIDITDKGNLNSLSGEIVINGEVTVSDDTPLTGGRLDSLTVTGKFDLPHGGTEDREDTPEKGSTRFNQDLGQLEFYTGYEWRTVNSYSDSGGRGRGVIMGGRDTPGATVSEIDFIQVTTLGNSQSFGDLQSGNMEAGACCADSTRALKTGGTSGGTEYDNIDYVTIASQGNSIDFGNLQAGTRGHGCCSSSSRGVTGGGVIAPNSDTNRMDYFEIRTLGNALDFGDLVVTERNISMISSPTRGVHDGGNYPSTTTLGHFTIASKGNSIEFGSNSRSAYGGGVVGNNIRGIFCGGYNASGASEGIKKIEYITFSSLGKTTNFGELSGLVSANNGGMSNNSRGVIGPGNKTFTGSVDYTNTLEYITISTLGNAQDFGDVSGPMRTFSPKVSDSHGGLGGF